MKELVEPFEYVPPGAVTIERLKPYMRDRSFHLQHLKPLEDRKCVWCNVGDLKTYRHKYCQDNCRTSAFIFCNPQIVQAKAWVFMQQDFKCGLCSKDYTPLMLQKAERAIEGMKKFIKDHPAQAAKRDLAYSDTITLHKLGYGTGDLIEVDHKVAIVNGGDGIGLENIHVVCCPCHRKKTKVDMLTYHAKKSA